MNRGAIVVFKACSETNQTTILTVKPLQSAGLV